MIVLRCDDDRKRASGLLAKAPSGTRVEFKASKRTLPQNDKFWAVLTDIARQLVWHGQKLRPEEWKLVILNALKRERRLVANIDGNGFVDLGYSSSDLSKEEMTEAIELALAFGAQHGVKFKVD